MPTVNMFVESKLATLPACLWMRGQRWGYGQRAAECYTLHGQADKMVGSWGPLVHDLWTTTVNQFPPPVRHYRQQLVISDPISSLYTLHHSSPIVTSMYIDIHDIYLKAQLKNLYEACTKNYALRWLNTELWLVNSHNSLLWLVNSHNFLLWLVNSISEVRIYKVRSF